MDAFMFLLALSTVPQLALSEPVPLTPVLDLVSGESRVFSGESVQLRCRVPDPYNSTWGARWFHDKKRITVSESTLTLRNTRVKQSGKYYCKGTRDSVVGIMETLESLPVEINVDGGYAILQAPALPSLVGEDLTLTCRVRSRGVTQVILYKDDVEVKTQLGSTRVTLPNVSLEDRGDYYCRASWDTQQSTVEAISVKTHVSVLEVMTKPVLQFITDHAETPAHMIRIVCHHEYNARPPAPRVVYYFYRNNRQMGTAQSNNYNLVSRVSGQYKCKAKVSQLGLVLFSEPKSFEI